jgi:hypothetical protein
MFDTNTELPHVIADLGGELDLAMIRAEDERVLTTTPAARPTRSRWRGFALVFAAIAATALVVMLIVSIGGRGSKIGVQDALAEVAHRLKIAPHPKPSQFEYTRTRAISMAFIDGGIDQMGRLYKSFLYIAPFETEWAISTTRDGRGRMRGGKISYPTPADQRNGTQYFDASKEHDRLYETAAGRKRLRAINHRVMTYNKAHKVSGIAGVAGTAWTPASFSSRGRVSFAGESLTPAQLAKYPRDPKAMYERISRNDLKQRKHVERLLAEHASQKERDNYFALQPTVDEEVWTALTDPSWNAIPEDLLAARILALGYLPGLEAAGEGTDAFGRSGPRFIWTSRGLRNEIVYDEQTGVQIMSQSQIVDPAVLNQKEFRTLPKGTTINQFQLVDQKTLDSMPGYLK